MRKFFSKYKADLGAILILSLLVVIFFSRLFFPKPAIFAIPDFGLSDIWHFNYPQKELLSRSLKNNSLPLWTKLIGTGFPPFAQAEIGSFNIINLILYKIFPTWLAFNLTYVASFLLISIGSYLYTRYINLNRLSSFFAASLFTFSGFFTAQVNHLSHIQTASFLPLLFLSAETIIKKPNLKRALFFSFILSQQIFSGHYQYVFISLSSLSFYTFFRVLCFSNKKRHRNKILFYILAAIILGIIFSSIQLFPSFEFFLNSLRKNVSSRILAVSLTLRHLLILINPYAAGNPITSQYPHGKGGYWEISSFIGIIPILLMTSSLLLLRNKKWAALIKSYFLTLLISFFLFLGKDSPFYFILSIPPFSYFRIPSRFILVVLWSITILSSIRLNSLAKKFGRKLTNSISLILVGISIIPLLQFAYKYQVITNYSNLLSPPETARNLQVKPDKRIFSISEGEPWVRYFLSSGWQNIEPYFYFRNNLDSNLSLIFNFPQASIYSGTPLRRQYFFNSLIIQKLSSNREPSSKEIKINDSSLKLLGSQAVEKIVSPFKLENQNLKKIYETKENLAGFPSYKIYENKAVLPRALMVYKYRKVDTVEELQRTLASPDFKPEEEVVLEKEINESASQRVSESMKNSIDSLTQVSEANDDSLTPSYKVNWLKDEDQEIELEVVTEKEGFLVLADTYYPGWKAYVDGQETEILAANLNQRAIRVGEGSHKVRFSYQPKSFKLGAVISITSYLIIIFLLVFPSLFSFAGKAAHKNEPSPHP